MRYVMLSAVLVLMLAAAATEAQFDKGDKVIADRDWVAIISDSELAKKAPKSGMIANQKEFAALWKAWRSDEKVPEINFTKKIIVVTTALGGPNKPSISAVLTDKGDLKILAISTLIGGDGFGYSIAEFDRKGVKTINGKALPKE